MEKTAINAAPKNVDRIAQHYLNRYLPTDGTAITTTGDGDCLFNAASILLSGDEALAVELKYKCCLEMGLNAAAIKNHKDRAALILLSPDYSDALVRCATGGGYSSAWTMIALSNVTQHKIKMLYPMVNGLKDLAVRTLNTLIEPSTSVLEDKTLRIMWTNTSSWKEGSKKTWIPNHFVPVFDTEIPLVKTSTPTAKGTSSIFIPQQQTDNHSRWSQMKKRSRKPLSPIRALDRDMDLRNRFQQLSESEESEECIDVEESSYEERYENPQKKRKRTKRVKKEQRKDKQKRAQEEDASGSETDNSPKQKKRNSRSHRDERKSASISSDPQTSLEESPKLERKPNRKPTTVLKESDSDDDTPSSPKTSPPDSHPTLLALPTPGKFLTVEEQLDAITKTDRPLQNIPFGNKTNSYCIVDNSKNTIKREKNIRSNFVDDCGLWDSKSGNTVNLHFLLTDEKRLKSITSRNGTFCTEKKRKNQQSIWEPLSEQPTVQNLFKIHRYNFPIDNYRIVSS